MAALSLPELADDTDRWPLKQIAQPGWAVIRIEKSDVVDLD
jgi:hypothetical protein